jgi:hypothetical protein
VTNQFCCLLITAVLLDTCFIIFFFVYLIRSGTEVFNPYLPIYMDK